MSTCYEVTYRNMWPSEALNHRIGERADELRCASDSVQECYAWFDRSTDDRLGLRIEVIADGTPHEAHCSVAAQKTHADVCAAIDEMFRELHRELSTAHAA